MDEERVDGQGTDHPVTTMHVRRAVQGDADSLNWIVSRLTPLLVVQADYRLGPALRKDIDPEDLVNEAWAVALPRLDELGQRDGRVTPVLLKFLSTTMTYRINKLLRRRLTDKRAPLADDGIAELPAETSGVVTQAVRREARSAVHRQLDELDPIDREVIVLRGIEQHPAKTVAVMLEISPAAVDQRYSRALRRLRGKLEESVFAELDE